MTIADTDIAKPRITRGALRMRASRQRRREGMRSYIIDLRDTEIDRLVDLGHLRADDRGNKNAVLLAIYRFLDNSELGDAQQ